MQEVYSKQERWKIQKTGEFNRAVPEFTPLRNKWQIENATLSMIYKGYELAHLVIVKNLQDKIGKF